MYLKKYLFIILISLGGFTAGAQYHSPVLPGLNGQVLLNGLVGSYKPDNILDYDNARDSMFANIFSRNDSLFCVYSGHGIYLNPNEDPTEAAYMNGGANGINTEHTWPQAFGAANGNARSNMYHLFPTRIEVNGDRGNSPFTEIPDNQTDEWYYLNESQSFTPSQSVIHLYSERNGSTFEPREDHKGDVARAMFYFYTMYKAEADNANPDFFETQRATLCSWHLDDPVDEKEWQRNLKIATYQEGKYNPFILDCTLPERCYCEDQNTLCTPTALGTGEPEEGPFKLEQNFPNPFSTLTSVKYTLDRPCEVRLVVSNMLGQTLKVLVDERQAAGEYQNEIGVFDLSNKQGDIPAGVYMYRLEVTHDGVRYFQTRKFVVSPQ